VKWEFVKKEQSDIKYLICNGDEGDPGAFMDRMLLESYPYRVIEGMIIAAYAVGLHQGYFYIRAEYPLAVKRIRKALEICREKNYMGNNIMGSGLTLI
jgi:NADH-quinone oxidoreductase subunit F